MDILHLSLNDMLLYFMIFQVCDWEYIPTHKIY